MNVFECPENTPSLGSTLATVEWRLSKLGLRTCVLVFFLYFSLDVLI